MSTQDSKPKKIKKIKPPVIVSHVADLDGVAGAVVAAEYFRSQGQRPEVHFAEYKDAEGVLDALDVQGRHVWVMDLSFTDPKPLLRLASRCDVLRVFDHHASSTEAFRRLLTEHDVTDQVSLYFDPSGVSCATDLVWKYTKPLLGVPHPGLSALVASAHSRDLWVRDVEAGERLTDVVHVLGAREVFGLLSQDISRTNTFTAEMEGACRQATTNREESKALARRTHVKTPIGMLGKDFPLLHTAQCLGDQSDIGEMLLRENTNDYGWVGLIDVKRQNLSFRSNKYTIDRTTVGVDAIAEKFGGGGHPCAAGGKLTEELLHGGSSALAARMERVIAELLGRQSFPSFNLHSDLDSETFSETLLSKKGHPDAI